MERQDIQPFVGKEVTLTTVSGSKYAGVVSRTYPSRFSVIKLCILFKDGTYKAVSGDERVNKRYFRYKNIEQVLSGRVLL